MADAIAIIICTLIYAGIILFALSLCKVLGSCSRQEEQEEMERKKDGSK